MGETKGENSTQSGESAQENFIRIELGESDPAIRITKVEITLQRRNGKVFHLSFKPGKNHEGKD